MNPESPLSWLNNYPFVLIVAINLSFLINNPLAVTGDDELPTIKTETSFKPVKPSNKVRLLAPCQLCREVIRSFEWSLKATDDTSVDHGAGFKDSPERLTEIMKKLCADSKHYSDQCQTFSDKYKGELNSWWFNERREGISLHDFLCIDKSQVCCPDGMYGADCSPCPGYPENICNGHGSCKGNGTRKGNGHCVCYRMYQGDQCEKCASGYFVISEKEGLQECEKCDRSCLGQCKGKGSKGCHACKEGYLWDTEYGCIDIDECIELPANPCSGNTFCVNTDGSHQCYECDKACDGCHGDGPDSCTKCAIHFVMKDGLCVNTKLERREAELEKSRYITYLGLCFATCIIFQKNIYIASGIGLLVALYIGAAEYTVRDLAEAPIF